MAGGQIDLFADVLSKGDQEFTLVSIESEQRSAELALTGEINVADLAEQGGRFGERTWRGSDGRRSGREFEDGAADQIGDKIGAEGKFGAPLPGDLDVKAAQLFGVVDGGDAREMKHALAGVIAVQPERLQGCLLPGAGICGEKKLLLLLKAVGKIGEEFDGDFTFISARAQDAGYRDEFLRGRVDGKSHAEADLFFENFQGEATMKLHAGSAEKSAHGFGGAALPTDDFA